MPSGAKGISLNLVLAGSKVAIVGPGAIQTHNLDYFPGSKPGQRPNYQGVKFRDQAALQNSKFSGIYQNVSNTDVSSPDRFGSKVVTDLPLLRFNSGRNEMGKIKINSGKTRTIPGNGGGLGIEDVQFTNRQKVLLDKETNFKSNIKMGSNNEQSPSFMSIVNRSPPFGDTLSPNQQWVAQVNELQDDKSHTDLFRNYNLKGNNVQMNNKRLDNGQVTRQVRKSSRSAYIRYEKDTKQLTQALMSNISKPHEHSFIFPSPPSGKRSMGNSPAWRHSANSRSTHISPNSVTQGTPRSVTDSDQSDPSDSYHEVDNISRDYINTVAQENQVIKIEVQKSLKRLLQHAALSGTSSPRPTASVEETDLETQPLQNDFANYVRRRSINSQDSGISSESVTCDLGEYQPDVELQQAKSLYQVPSPDLTIGPGSLARQLKKKKLSNRHRKKHKSRLANKKSKSPAKKSQPECIHKGNVDVELTPENAMNLSAYCRVMHVLPSLLKHKGEQGESNVPKSIHESINKAQGSLTKNPTTAVKGSSYSEVQSKHALNKTHMQGSMVTIYKEPLVCRLSQPFIAGNENNSTNKGGPSNGYMQQHPSTSKFGNDGVEEAQRIAKVYLSERQSGLLNELGMTMPCAPPTTPMPVQRKLSMMKCKDKRLPPLPIRLAPIELVVPEALRKVEYIPSMYDIRAQRAFKSKLEVMDRLERKRTEKKLEQKAKKEKAEQKTQVNETKRIQRLQIYALNKVMTALENKNFIEFCSANGICPDL